MSSYSKGLKSIQACISKAQTPPRALRGRQRCSDPDCLIVLEVHMTLGGSDDSPHLSGGVDVMFVADTFSVLNSTIMPA